MRKIWIPVLLLASPVFGQDATSAVYYDNVVMVVDASGSMGYDWTGTNTEKMDIAKDAMKTVLSKIGENTRIGIVVFGRGGTEWVYPLGPKNNQALTEAIDNIRVGGGTPLGTYIKKGADALVLQRQKQFGYGSYRLLIVTDGEASGSGEAKKMKTYTQEIIARGINVDVIGVDMGEEHALAKIVGDNYRAADDPASLTKAITAVFAEVNRQDADDPADNFELLEGLDPNLAKQMIGALAKPRNHPIGTNPKLNISSSAEPDTFDPASLVKWFLGGAGGIIFVIAMVKIFSGSGYRG